MSEKEINFGKVLYSTGVDLKPSDSGEYTCSNPVCVHLIFDYDPAWILEGKFFCTAKCLGEYLLVRVEEEMAWGGRNG